MFISAVWDRSQITRPFPYKILSNPIMVRGSRFSDVVKTSWQRDRVLWHFVTRPSAMLSGHQSSIDMSDVRCPPSLPTWGKGEQRETLIDLCFGKFSKCFKVLKGYLLNVEVDFKLLGIK